MLANNKCLPLRHGLVCLGFYLASFATVGQECSCWHERLGQLLWHSPQRFSPIPNSKKSPLHLSIKKIKCWTYISFFWFPHFQTWWVSLSTVPSRARAEMTLIHVFLRAAGSPAASCAKALPWFCSAPRKGLVFIQSYLFVYFGKWQVQLNWEDRIQPAKHPLIDKRLCPCFSSGFYIIW